VSQLPILPILLPFFAGVAIALAGRGRPAVARVLGEAAGVGGLLIALLLFYRASEGELLVYALGDWPAPFGIVLMVDRLSAIMVVLTALLALAALCYAHGRPLTRPVSFQTLFQFQLMGLNGAFLTGDLFNLFVFFEVLLIASYGLLVIEGGSARMRAGLHYVLINLAGSSLFLIGLGIIYGTAGTLNLADLIHKLPLLPVDRQPLIAAAGLLLLVVFGLKAALAPLYLWLPATYAAAPAPVAALFAVMTKVGAYAILRVHAVMFMPGGSPLGGLAHFWLILAAVLSLVLGAIGVLASPTLRRQIGYLVVVSLGTLMLAVAIGSEEALAASLYYLAHSTLVTAALFLLADLIASQRSPLSDELEPGEEVDQPTLLGGLFLVLCISVAGLPPFSGFFGKLMILHSTATTPLIVVIWTLILASSLVVSVGLSRAGSRLFWKTTKSSRPAVMAGPILLAPVIVLASASGLLVVFGASAQQFALDAAEQLLDRGAYVQSVLGENSRQGP
jgi:multicomponent K+:H+ antiporter subunit D